METAQLTKLALRIRHDILTMTTTAGSGHPTSSLSAVELMTVLFFKYLRYDLSDPDNPGNDRVIFSKGHASPLYYALYAASGVIENKELLKYRTFDSVLEGHPTERFKYTEAATGSLGQGLSVGLGEALAIRMNYDLGLKIQEENKSKDLKSSIVNLTSLPRVYVLAGDGEVAEGSVWEAAASASFQGVDNLILIVDVNRLGQSGPTMYGGEGVRVFASRFEAFGWRVLTVENGNNLEQVDRAFEDTFKGTTFKGRPTVILAKTKKGAGISFLADLPGWHGKPLSKDELPKAIAELGAVDLKFKGKVEKPLVSGKGKAERGKSTSPLTLDPLPYPSDKPVATRKAFGNALLRLGKADPSLVVIDGDVKNSTYTEFFGTAFPDRFFELYIAEQNMTGVAVGFSARGYHPVVSSFACFLTRAADQIRMAAFSGANIIFNGSHAGVSIGEDGPSQMGLEDLALFRTVRGSTVLYPSDALSTERLTEDACRTGGICYIRTSKPETPILYARSDAFPVGGSKTHHSAQKELVTVVAAGITLHEALKAQKELEKEKVGIRVIDCYSVKPIDRKSLVLAAVETKGLIVVEDHYPEGGLGEAVASALAGTSKIPLVHLAVTKTPRSGTSAELLAFEGIDAAGIMKTVRTLTRKE